MLPCQLGPFQSAATSFLEECEKNLLARTLSLGCVHQVLLWLVRMERRGKEGPDTCCSWHRDVLMDFSLPGGWVHLSWALRHSVEITLPLQLSTSHPVQTRKKGVLSPLHSYLMAQRAFIKHRGTQWVVTMFVFLRFLLCCAWFPKWGRETAC